MRIDAATDKLLKALTGKEAFQLVMTTYLEHAQGKEVVFSEADIDKVIAGLSNRPHEQRAYYRWGESHEVINMLQSETRIAALDALWRLSAFSNQISSTKRRTPARKDKGKALLAQLPEFQLIAQKMEGFITTAARFNLMLEAFGEVLGIDILIMTQHEITLLTGQIALYNKMAAYFNDDMHYAAYYSDNTVDENATYLPALSIYPATLPANMKHDFIDDIERARSTSFWDVVKGLGDVQ